MAEVELSIYHNTLFGYYTRIIGADTNIERECMSKVAACFLVALGIGFLIVIDVISIAPSWTIYLEGVGIFLALLAAALYYMHHTDLKRSARIGDPPVKK
ncbi:MAG: hypothetical protein HQ503_01985 [Rhodospirillales bacterium]|nr:hypothetical protein [Rhodospirillales bacterium]